MEARGKTSRHRTEAARARRKAGLLILGVFLLLVVIAAFFWMISSPIFLKSNFVKSN
jgi:hypothetical protein